MNILSTMSVTAVAGKSIIPLLTFIWGKITQNSRRTVKYKTAVLRSGIYDHDVKEFGEMCHQMLTHLLVRHSDGNSRKYGFWYVVETEKIDNPEKFIKFIVASQNNCDDPWQFGEVTHLLKVF